MFITLLLIAVNFIFQLIYLIFIYLYTLQRNSSGQLGISWVSMGVKTSALYTE